MASEFATDQAGLYSKLGVLPSATLEEIVDSYKKEVTLFEEAAKLSRKDIRFKEADCRYREVSKAFTILSDASYRQRYDNSQTVPDLPKVTRNMLKTPKDYLVKYNEQSITIFLPQNLARIWLESCEDYHGTKATNGGKNGHHIKFPFVDAKTKEEHGSVSIKVYETTQKLLIQGSAYLLWFSNVFHELRTKISGSKASPPPVPVSARSTDVLIVSTDVSDSRSLCQTCDQPLTDDNCLTCTTTPKSVYDENCNVTRDQEDVLNTSIQVSPVDVSVIQENVTKLEAQNHHNKEQPLDVLILGDSNTKAIKPEILYPDKSAKSDVTFNLTEAEGYIQNSALPAPKVILFHIGTNDVRDARDAATVTEGFRRLVHVAHDKYPSTNLVFSPILPRDDSHLMDIGDDINSFLKVVADETSYVHITDNSNLSSSGTIKKSLFVSDGYHLNRYGTRVLAANFKRALNPLIGLGEYKGRRSQLASNQPSPIRSYRDVVIGAPTSKQRQSPSRPPTRHQPMRNQTSPTSRPARRPSGPLMGSRSSTQGQGRTVPFPENGPANNTLNSSTQQSSVRKEHPSSVPTRPNIPNQPCHAPPKMSPLSWPWHPSIMWPPMFRMW
ncbi:hypothetical protein Bbelb_024600 [Branchiostoma belcheri]|nr:hypothetical protein Bbelb_024600 [Branchiostoma belcheri]